MKQLGIALALVFCSSIQVFAQKVSEELRKVREAYLSSENFSADVTVTGYINKGDRNGTLIGTGTLKKIKNAYYSKFGTDEMLSNTHCTVIINHFDKEIIFIGESKNTYLQKKQPVLPDFDSLLTLNDSVLYQGIKNGMKLFSFYKQSSPIYRTEVFVDAQTLLVRSIIYYYAEENEEDNYDMDHVLIEYKNVSVKKPDENIFSEKIYFVTTKGKPVLIESYKKYKLTIVENEKI